jgi:hypothetical protein
MKVMQYKCRLFSLIVTCWYYRTVMLIPLATKVKLT